MFKITKRKIFLTAIIVLFLVGQFSQSNVLAQGGVTFSETQTENHFPDSMTFRVNVSSKVRDIVSAQFVFIAERYYSINNYARADVDVATGADVTLEFTLESGTAVPMTPFTYYWDVVDSQGVHHQSETKTVRYEDTRYNWQELKNSKVWVLWHDQPDSFGKNIFEIANQAIQQQNSLFHSDLDYQIIILIYDDFDEFAAWHGIAHDWVGGQSFPEFGITTQIVEDTSDQFWLEAVIPHEISHLYFEQVTYNPKVSVPVWLNEGVAQYNEFSTNSLALRNVRSSAQNEDLISLASLENGFGAFNEDRVHLAYDEALSAVTYLVAFYGEADLGALLKAYKQGITTNDAFRSALGVDARTFESDWAEWAGFPGEYVPPTPRSLPTFIPSPTMFVHGSSPPTPATAIAQGHHNQEGVKTPTPLEENPPATNRNIPCVSGFLALGLGLTVWLPSHHKKHFKEQQRDG